MPPFFVIVGLVVLAWNLAVPGQPYYAIAAFLPALALGWGALAQEGTDLWRRARVVIASNAVVAAALCLPLVPASSPVFAGVAALDPVARDQVGWPELVHKVADARAGNGRAVVTDSYALTGALVQYGPASGIERHEVASGHNALWSLGPPSGEAVLLVGRFSPSQRAVFRACTNAGHLPHVARDPYDLAGTPMWRCDGLRMPWRDAWPRFARLGG